MSYGNINMGEGYGFTFQAIIKGVSQYGAQVVNSALDPNNGLADLGSIVIIFALLGLVLGSILYLKHKGEKLAR